MRTSKVMYIEQFFFILERFFQCRISFRSFCFRFLTNFIQDSFVMTTNPVSQASFHGSSVLGSLKLFCPKLQLGLLTQHVKRKASYLYTLYLDIIQTYRKINLKNFLLRLIDQRIFTLAELCNWGLQLLPTKLNIKQL